jgi:3-oxoadipate enol-lactonase
MFVTVNDVSLFVEDRGEGTLALVFLHYWGGTHRTWDKVIKELGSGFRTIAYDTRGWGQSAPAANGYALSALADDAAALVKHLQIKEYVLIGHSMGGKIAQLLASRKLEGLVGLILVAPASPGPFRLPEEAKEQQLHAYDSRDTVIQTIQFLSARMPDPETVEQMVEDSLSSSADAKLAWPTSGILEDLSEEASQIRTMTLVLAGELDRLHPVEQQRSEVIPKIPNAELQIVPQAGHLLPVEEPVKLADAIRRFVSAIAK